MKLQVCRLPQNYYSLLLLVGVLIVMQLIAWLNIPQTLKTTVVTHTDFIIEDVPIKLYGASQNYVRFTALIESSRDLAVTSGMKVRIYCYKQCNGVDLIKGASYSGVISLRPFNYVKNPTSFDYTDWLLEQGFVALGVLRTVPTNVKQPIWLEQTRQRFIGSLERATSNLVNQPLLLALLDGGRNRLSGNHKKLLIETSTMHLMVVSGLHLSLLFVLCIGLLRLSGAAPSWQLLGGIVAMMLYVWLADFGKPTIRALVMASIGALWLFRSRQRSLWFAWFVALVLVAGSHYGFWRDAGIVLSFVAVGVLIHLASNCRVRPWWRILIETQWIFFVLLGLVQIWLFQRFSPVGIVANMLLIPLVSLVLLPLVLSAAIISLVVPPVAGWLFIIADQLGDILWWLLGYLHSIPFASLEIAGEQLHSWPLMVASALLGLTVLFPVVFPLGRLLAIVAILPMLWWVAADRHSPLVLATSRDLYVLILSKDNTLVVSASARGQLHRGDLRFVLAPALRYFKTRNIYWLGLNQGAASLDAKQLTDELRYDQKVYSQKYCQLDPELWKGLSIKMLNIDPKHKSCQLEIDHASWVVTPDLDSYAATSTVITFSENWALAQHAGKVLSSLCVLVGRRIDGLEPCVQVDSQLELSRSQL